MATEALKVGVLGTGQLCWMMAEAAQTMNLDIVPIGEYENTLLDGISQPKYLSSSDTDALLAALNDVDVITFETESVSSEVMSVLQQHPHLLDKCRPNLKALTIFQHRLNEKNYFSSLSLPTAKYHVVEADSDVHAAAAHVGFPMILKTSTGGYDGKGQALVKSLDELTNAWVSMDRFPCIAEEFIAFDHEVSIIGARDVHGNVVFYPLNTNHHRDGILRLSVIDGKTEQAHQAHAESIMTSILTDLDYVGCMTLEFFVHNNGLLLNEVAPRVHNSGHWTIDASDVSQFALHLKAVSGEVIKTPINQLPAAMLNCIGEIPDAARSLTNASIKFYDYTKEARPKRKLGHINMMSGTFNASFNHAIKDYVSNQDESALLDRACQTP